MNATGTAEWHEVLAGLRGERLRIYDEATRLGGWVDPTRDHEEASRWLHYHRMIWLDEFDGHWKTRPMAEARRLWETSGPNTRAAAQAPERPPLASSTPERRPAVQAHQAQFFDLDGY